MTISAQPRAFFADFGRMRALRWIFAAAVLAAVVAAPDAADAARRARIVRAGAYDGVWNVVFATQAGNCSSTNSVPFTVSGHRGSSAAGGKVTGGIGRGGSVSVRISVGASVATGSGRLAGNSGGGRGSGIIFGDRCRGIWQAARGWTGARKRPDRGQFGCGPVERDHFRRPVQGHLASGAGLNARGKGNPFPRRPWRQLFAEGIYPSVPAFAGTTAISAAPE